MHQKGDPQRSLWLSNGKSYQVCQASFLIPAISKKSTSCIAPCVFGCPEIAKYSVAPGLSIIWVSKKTRGKARSFFHLNLTGTLLGHFLDARTPSNSPSKLETQDSPRLSQRATFAPWMDGWMQRITDHMLTVQGRCCAAILLFAVSVNSDCRSMTSFAAILLFAVSVNSDCRSMIWMDGWMDGCKDARVDLLII